MKFNIDPIKRICEASGLKLDVIMASEDNVAAILVKWYLEHIRVGGEKDDVAEKLYWETVDETFGPAGPMFS
ncbi:MAG: hypothetical protein LBS57_08075 [Treponema sp.]|nr:hypothetical protein [Treponema sp.]